MGVYTEDVKLGIYTINGDKIASYSDLVNDINNQQIENYIFSKVIILKLIHEKLIKYLNKKFKNNVKFDKIFITKLQKNY